ncbi:GNAT family N-acetyltransferase [Christiangramia echinicola]|uniref:Protein N-acetyltransferase, RimJ/RimL family n=1 Tax=Christiangramia echinicola TaxID=279359 RepID=A0A1H1NC93_9FLAO|nr:GNAT family N-acetyltransferase [Christiangramia echinicola]SDR96651.1 Protein N-acetyltransferase, RimJ/RimL family [Christiangramia echinicola]
MKSYKAFETERLIIRPTSIEDKDFIYKLLNSPKWLRYIGDRNVRSSLDAEKYIVSRMLPQLEKLGFSNNTILKKEDGVKIGTCGLFDREGLYEVDIGFAFLPEYENLGYAFEATSTLKRAAKDEFGLTNLSAITLEENKASRKLLEKLEFKFKEKIRLPEDPAELMLYSLRL